MMLICVLMPLSVLLLLQFVVFCFRSRASVDSFISLLVLFMTQPELVEWPFRMVLFWAGLGNIVWVYFYWRIGK